MSNTFNYNHLYYFYVTAKVGSVTKAAKILRTSQPSLSTQLKTLEGQLGRSLFRRKGRSLELTHEGRVIFGYCAKSFEATDALSQYLRHMKKVTAGRFVLGVSEEIDRLFVTKNLTKALAKLTPEETPSIKMISLPHEALASKLAVSEVDFLITAKRVYDRDAHLVSEVKLPVVLVGAKKVTPTRHEPGPLLKSLSTSLVLPSPELKLRDEVDNFIQRNHINKGVAFECNMLSALLQAVRGGVGVGFFPLPYVREALASRSVHQLSQKILWHHRVLFFSTPALAQSKFVLALSEQLRSVSY